MDNVLQQLSNDHLFTTQSQGILEVFRRYLKPILMKLCEKDQDTLDKYINPNISQLPCNT